MTRRCWVTPGWSRPSSSAAGLAAANARLQAEVRARLAEIAASRRRILAAGDEERGRLEHRLREGAQRRLGELAQALRLARQSATGQATAERIARAELQLTRTQEDLGRLARGLHPRQLVRARARERRWPRWPTTSRSAWIWRSR